MAGSRQRLPVDRLTGLSYTAETPGGQANAWSPRFATVRSRQARRKGASQSGRAAQITLSRDQAAGTAGYSPRTHNKKHTWSSVDDNP
ncbi:putative medium-chain acyl-CoA ligase domain protein [Pseudomonas paraeruginosa]|uniref:Medium-chain acyl-CoA ligase domain protein n=1 Tax=Pseudomonas paraeruginosa TaxID=2994495 RepID=A0A2R3J0M5_9PSED|nr:putative medium-chain acyl-CoA ligase domain protein [Pseudomonas paraeruginosa]AWE93002.1 putative medium-chain acyl-CoA ligase domain protein [Pseudomonas paraeruginosa]PTC38647.1 hypothetical protein CLJ1_0925 [Pseudomonas aeruginosa]